ncbi:DUF4188 domain-containing protein [Nocardiopsis sp. MG754419]|uniref:DUF4188 domain-containing protein n=1 Tax=Nocardiopsis sp. MG754419 TaxID=2259865 RepID=UPI001BA76147|nr:DUF4188 domain-containing protein [Nocardiopsis sp. MG754419]MBR8743535.1 DUF4188 domain-containing protein [Nocardiopsis sp. MG754419]
MAKIVSGRMTHHHDGELVVFHVGMTINRWLRPDLWWPVARLMPPMLRELSQDPDSGLLGYEMLLNARGPHIVQYWSSIDRLYDYASATSLSHRPAWTRFNAMARRNPDAVGIWHETHVVERAESVYVGTPVMGLPAATALRPVEKHHHRARARLADGATTAPEDARSHPRER